MDNTMQLFRELLTEETIPEHRKDPAKNHLKQDLEADLLASEYFDLYDEEDSLDYVVDELVTPESTDEDVMEAQRVVRELEEDSEAVSELDSAVEELYEMREFMDKRAEMGLAFSQADYRKANRYDFEIMERYVDVVETLASLDFESERLDRLTETGERITGSREFEEVREIVEHIREYGEIDINIQYDMFERVNDYEIQENSDSRVIGALDGLREFFSVKDREDEFYHEVLDDRIERNEDHIREVMGLRKELDYLTGTQSFIDEMRSRSMPLEYPEVGDENRLEEMRNPLLFTQEGKDSAADIVPNSFETGDGQITVLTGINNGGKTVYAKSVGLSYLLGQNGLPVPAEDAKIDPFGDVQSHFINPDDITSGEGMFQDEVRRMKDVLQRSDRDSLVIMDEPVRGTSEEANREMALRFLDNIDETGASVMMTTHQHEVADRVDDWNSVVNLQAEVEEKDGEARPTYRMVEGAAGSSYAEDIAEKMGFTDDQLEDLV